MAAQGTPDLSFMREPAVQRSQPSTALRASDEIYFRALHPSVGTVSARSSSAYELRSALHRLERRAQRGLMRSGLHLLCRASSRPLQPRHADHLTASPKSRSDRRHTTSAAVSPSCAHVSSQTATPQRRSSLCRLRERCRPLRPRCRRTLGSSRGAGGVRSGRQGARLGV
jgi:hypothetical protein